SRSYLDRLAPESDPELVPIWPEADPDRIALGEAYIRLDEFYGPQRASVRRGLEILGAAPESGSEDSRRLLARGIGKSALGDGRSAAARSRRLLERDPTDHDVRYRLAIACEQAGREREAITEYSRLLDAEPDWLEPYPRLVRLLLKHNDVEG